MNSGGILEQGRVPVRRRWRLMIRSAARLSSRLSRRHHLGHLALFVLRFDDLAVYRFVSYLDCRLRFLKRHEYDYDLPYREGDYEAVDYHHERRDYLYPEQAEAAERGSCQPWVDELSHRRVRDDAREYAAG